MEERLLLALLAGATIFGAFVLFFVFDERHRRQLLDAVRLSAATPETVASRRPWARPPKLLLGLARLVPPPLVGVVRRGALIFGDWMEPELGNTWEQARIGLALLLAAAIVLLAVIAAVWLATLLLVAPTVATSVVNRQFRRLDWRRRQLIEREAVPALGVIVLALEAGLPLERAFNAYASIEHSELAAELLQTARELEVGYRRREALQRCADRTGSPRVAAIANAVRIAEDFGTPVAVQLRTLAAEMRVQRHQQLQEMALRAPINMLLPTVAFILPPIFVVVLGPIVILVLTGGLF